MYSKSICGRPAPRSSRGRPGRPECVERPAKQGREGPRGARVGLWAVGECSSGRARDSSSKFRGRGEILKVAKFLQSRGYYKAYNV